jgi:DNA gyrase subunit B
MLTSDEIKNLIVAMGAGIGDEFNIEKVRYHRVIIMTDADVDGAHIRTLLLTLFFRHFPELIKSGYIYIAQPPLYAIGTGKNKKYAYSDAEKEDILKEYKNSEKVNIQRYKGLGEMNPTQLWETTMDPAKRVLLRVNIEDANEADEVFSMLMGDEVAPRKKFIQSNATEVKNLDI